MTEKSRTRRITALLMTILAVLALAGCHSGGEQTQPTVQTTQPPALYSVSFQVMGQTVSLQTVEEGSCPESVAELTQGLTVMSWRDAQGNTVRPEVTPVTGDTVYTAVAYPALDTHAPYLFADENGFLWPDSPVTERDVALALEALAIQEALAYFPELPRSEQNMAAQPLRELLSGFFPEENVQAVFSGEAEQTVTRAAFAKGMLMLLGRSWSEPVAADAQQMLALDITAGRTDAAALLEASTVHSHDDQGTLWEQTVLPESYGPGFHNFSGWLYYMQDDGTFLRGGAVGDLYFGADGRYTCGDPELDTLVAQILDGIILENPEVQGLDLLRKAFEYCRDSFKYLRKNAYEMGDTGWEIEDAKVMFTTGRGNCYNYAATFWALARGLGYEAWAISGTCTGTYQPHGWVLIEIDGADYFFDPEWEMAYRTERQIYDKDMFMIPMNKIWYWTYEWKRF